MLRVRLYWLGDHCFENSTESARVFAVDFAAVLDLETASVTVLVVLRPSLIAFQVDFAQLELADARRRPRP